MELKDIRETPSDDLVKRLGEIAKEIFELSCTSERLTSQKGAEVRKLAKEIARIKTVIRQRELTDEVKTAMASIDARLAEIDAISGKNRTTEQRNARAKLGARKKELARVSRELEIVKGK